MLITAISIATSTAMRATRDQFAARNRVVRAHSASASSYIVFTSLEALDTAPSFLLRAALIASDSSKVDDGSWGSSCYHGRYANCGLKAPGPNTVSPKHHVQFLRDPFRARL